MTESAGSDMDLDAIQERCDAASPWPWKSGDDDDGSWFVTMTKDQDPETTIHYLYFGDMEDNTGQDIRNADFIGHARTDVPKLIRLCREARDEREAEAKSIRRALTRAVDALELARHAFEDGWAIDWGKIDRAINVGRSALATDVDEGELAP